MLLRSSNADSSLQEADHPLRQRRPPVANHPPLDAADAFSGAGGDASQKVTEPAAKDNADPNDLLRRALEAILQKTAGNSQGNDAGGADAAPRVVVEDVGDGEMVIEFISEIEMNDDVVGGGDAQRRVADDISRMMDSKVFEDALRAAGFDVRDEEVEVEVEVGTTEGEEGGQRKGKRPLNGAAKGRRRANAVQRDEL